MPRFDNETFYTAALSKHGFNARGVHWNSNDSQRIRFRVLRRFLPDDLSDITIVDAGCGLGDLYTFLERSGDAPKEYIGLEVVDSMAEYAHQQTGCKIIACDILHDPLPEADFYLCSGAMNILTRFETHLFIRRCFEASKEGFLFNLLKGEDESLVYNYFLPREIRKIAQELGASVRFTQGYLPRDFTTALYKGEED